MLQADECLIMINATVLISQIVLHSYVGKSRIYLNTPRSSNLNGWLMTLPCFTLFTIPINKAYMDSLVH